MSLLDVIDGKETRKEKPGLIDRLVERTEYGLDRQIQIWKYLVGILFGSTSTNLALSIWRWNEPIEPTEAIRWLVNAIVIVFFMWIYRVTHEHQKKEDDYRISIAARLAQERNTNLSIRELTRQLTYEYIPKADDWQLKLSMIDAVDRLHRTISLADVEKKLTVNSQFTLDALTVLTQEFSKITDGIVNKFQDVLASIPIPGKDKQTEPVKVNAERTPLTSEEMEILDAINKDLIDLESRGTSKPKLI
jgi:hypothetical protein